MWISIRFSQNTSISISFLLCIALDIPSDISNKARDNSLTHSLFLCLLSYNSLFSCALLRVSPNVDKSNMNILSTESFSSSGAYLTSSRAGPSRCAIRKGNDCGRLPSSRVVHSPESSIWRSCYRDVD